MTSVPTELDLLRRAARALLPAAIPATESVGAAARAAPLLWLGRRERALLLLREGGERNAWPAEVGRQLDELAACAQLQALARTHEIGRLHDLFAAQDLPLVVVDDWMFGRCFHPNRVLTETTDAIRCLVPAAQISRARQLLAASGHAEATQSFLVAPVGHVPVQLTATDEPIPTTSPLAIGSRGLPRLSDAAWLTQLATEAATRPALDLHRAWQVVFLFQRLGAAAFEGSEREHRGIARSQAALGLLAGDLSGILATPPPAASTSLPFSPFVPTAPNVVERMLALADVVPADLVCDLGCGDGRLPILAAQRHGARGRGIDRDPALIATARAAAVAAGVSDRVEFVCADLFSAGLGDTSVISLYLLPAVQEAVRKHLLARARPGTRVVSHDYFFPAWPPEKCELVRDGAARMAQIYLWRVP